MAQQNKSNERTTSPYVARSGQPERVCPPVVCNAPPAKGDRHQFALTSISGRQHVLTIDRAHYHVGGESFAFIRKTHATEA